MEIMAALILSCSWQDVDFVRQMMRKRRVTLADVSLAFSSLVGEAEPAKSAKEAAEILRKKNILPGGWQGELQEEVSLGRVCVLVCTTLEIKGGLVMRLFGNAPRTCYRECVSRSLVRANGPHSAVSGRDLLSLVGRVEEEQEKR